MKGGRDSPFKSSETRFPHSEAIGSVRRCINFVFIYFKTMYNKTIIREKADCKQSTVSASAFG